jgi:hypothetical protein
MIRPPVTAGMAPIIARLFYSGKTHEMMAQGEIVELA